MSYSEIFSKARRLFSMAYADRSMEEKFLSKHRDEAAQNLRWACLLTAAIMIGFMLQDSMISANGYKATRIRLFLGIPFSTLAWYLGYNLGVRRFIYYIIVFFFVIFSCLTAAILLVFEPGPYGLNSTIGSGSFFIVLFGIFCLFNLRFWVALLIGLLVILIYTISVVFGTEVDFDYFIISDFMTAVVMVLGGATKNFFAERERRRKFEMSVHLGVERERYKNLLYTMVPSEIAIRIENGEFPIVDSHAEVTILFSDIVDFTVLTRNTSPRVLIKVLNELFFEFDKAAERCSVEKIKTIGDGYMAICGPPIDEDQRSIAVVEFAKEMLATTRRVADKSGLPLKLRIGIHSGSLIAGVIGKSRFTYDVWGESVNLASRMESTGIAERIHISESAYFRLKSHYPCQERDIIDVKGVGLVKTYLLDIVTK